MGILKTTNRYFQTLKTIYHKSNKAYRLKSLLILGLSILLSACQSTNQTSVTASSRTVTENQVDAETKNHFNKATSLMNSGDISAAKNILSRLAQSHKNHPGIWANLGIIELSSNNLEQAYQHFTRALTIKPNHSVALNHLGLVYIKRNQFTEAETSFIKAIKNKPDYANAHFNLALLYDIYFQSPAKALPHYQQYIENSPTEDSEVQSWIETINSSLGRQ